MTSIRFEHIRKDYGSVTALEDVNLSIHAGELFFLLGPSGCGKSTLLRLLAGLIEPTSGRIYFGDQDVTRLPTEDRNAVMVFQSYALWPHMSVAENIRFGLSVRGEDRRAQQRRVSDMLELVRMSDYGNRKPAELSGGQQQRVALARALAVQPACLLLDEPLSNLDAKLRNEMRGEIRRICKSAGLTTIYVTHDQKEALAAADRVAVMDAGQIIQIGAPSELYESPSSRFVADFIGQMNLLDGEIIAQSGSTISIKTKIGTILGAGARTAPAQVTAGIRPSRITIIPRDDASGDQNRFRGKMIETIYQGESSEHVFDVNGTRIRIVCSPPLLDAPAEAWLAVDPKDVIVLNR